MSTKLAPEERELQRARRTAEAAEADARRRRAARQRWDAEGLYLTRAEFEAGEPCRGCGLPLRDGLGGFPPQLEMTGEQRAAHDAEEARWAARHGGCHGGRWSVQGSRTLHCTICCPFPPMSERQAEQIAQIIAARPSPASLMVWELTLTCGHITRRTAHRDHGRYGLTTDCSECGGEPRGVVAQVQVGPADEVARAEEEAAATRAVSSPKRPKLADVRRKLRAAEAQAEALRLQLAQMQQADPGD